MENVEEKVKEVLLSILDVCSEQVWSSSTGLSAIAYRPRRENAHTQIDWWTEALKLGSILPTMPLWIGTDIQVPVALETTYVATFERLRTPLVIQMSENNGR